MGSSALVTARLRLYSLLIEKLGKRPSFLLVSISRLTCSCKHIKHLTFVLIASILFACGGGSDPVEPAPPPPPIAEITVSGKVQKGLFTDLAVEVFPLGDNGELGESFSAQTQGSEYSFTVQPGQLVNVKASGRFIDETNGQERVVSTMQPLESVFAAGSAPQNVNILTTLVTTHWRANSNSSQSQSEQIEASSNVIKQNLGFDQAQNFNELDITSIESPQDPSFSLLMLSGAILNMDAQQNQNPQDTIPTAFSNTLDAIESGLPIADALAIFNGINVGEVFQQIQQAGVIETLPELIIEEGSFFICAPFCDFVIELNPTIVVNNLIIYEGQKSGLVQLSRTGTDLSELTLNLTFTDNSATVNQDYVSNTTQVTFNAGQTTQVVQVFPIIDNLSEGQETFNVEFSLPPNSGFSLNSSAATVTILDGVPSSAQIPSELTLSTIGCFVGLGLPTDLLQNANFPNQLVCDDTNQQGQAIESETDLTLQVLTGVQIDCTTNNCGNSTYWPFSLALDAVNPTNDNVESSLALGDLLYLRNQVLASNNDLPTQARLINVSTAQISDFLTNALANSHNVELRIGAASNVQASINPLPVSLPIIAPTSEIAFGQRSMQLIDGAQISPGDNCPNSEDLRVNGTFAYTIELGGQSSVVEYTGEVCANFTNDAQNGQVWTVTDSNIDITGTSILLPQQYIYFAEVTPVGSAPQRTTSAIPIALLASQNIAQLNAQFDSYIGAENLPFALRVDSASLTEQGIVINYDKSVLIDQAPFEPTDPRASQSSSNTNIYQNVSSGSLLLAEDGFTGVITMSSGSGHTAWPKGDLTWQEFTLELIDGQLQEHTLSVDFVMHQSRDCSSIQCSQGNTQSHSLSGMLTVDTQGTAIGTVQYANTASLSWGALSQGNAWELVNALQTGTSATLVLPGYTQRYLVNTSENAADGLLSHRRQSGFIHSTFGPTSDEFILGNFFAPGINIGPELYVNGSGQPEVANGTSLANLSFALNDNNQTAQTINTNEAAKFVIQNAGLTGVVNADPSQMPLDFIISAYDITLNRFALRTQNNINDNYNWVDGDLRLQGDAEIGIAFTNLDLACDGSPGEAQLSSNACGENCQLASWRSGIDVFTMAFTTADGEALQCSSQNAKLSLEHDIDFKALDKNLAARTIWNELGFLESSVVSAQSQYRLDSRESLPGYPMLLKSASLREPFDIVEPEAQRYGTLEMEASLGVPFWLPIEADIRLANTTDLGQLVAETSVVTPSSTFSKAAYKTLESTLNVDLQTALIADDQFDLSARYEWGGTGFGFELPVYYDVALAAQEVSFLGRRQQIDVFVLDAGAGIDFITPNSTKLSFGASADFAALKKTKFQVDLTNTDGLAKVDELLVTANIIQEPIITPTFEDIANAVNVVNNFAGKGIEPYMEKLLLEAVTSVGEASIPAMPNQKDPFETLADTMAAIKNFPNHLILKTDEVVFNPLNTYLTNQEEFLRSELLTVVLQIEALNPGDTLSNDIKQNIRSLQNNVSKAENSLQSLIVPIDSVLDDIVAQVTVIESAVNDAAAARDEIEGVLNEVTSVVATQCSIEGSVIGAESAGYLEAPFQQLADVKSLVQLLSNSDALATLADLMVDDQSVKESIRETQDTLREGATALLTKVSEAEVAIRSQLCQSDVTSLLSQANALLTQIDTHVSEMQDVITRVNTEITFVKSIVNTVEFQLLQPINKLNAVLLEIERVSQVELANANGEYVVDQVDLLLRNNTDGLINALVARNVADLDEKDIFTVAFNNVEQQVKTIRDSFVFNLQEDTKGLFPYGDMSADQLRRQLVNLLMDSAPVRDVRTELNKNIVEIVRQANSQVLSITDQANEVVSAALAQVENQVNDVLADATAPVRDIPLESAKLDGFGVITGGELERAHIGAQWTMSSSEEGEPGNTFGAALDAVSWRANGKAQGCAGPGAESNLDVTISAMGIPAKLGESEITIKKVYLGFTLAGAASGEGFTPIGVNGGISTSGEIGFTEFIIYDPAFAAGIGLQEVYLGASAGAVFSDIQAEVAFLVGKTCNQDILLELDPNVAQYIPIPPTGFAGAYVRGGASIPVYTNGCPLTIGVAAEVGAWILQGPPLTLGGLVGGGAYGKVGCVGALRGQIRAIGQVNTDGEFSFIGEGFAVAGLGLCEPASWTTVERSRQDGLCGTADAKFVAGFQNGWSVFNLALSAIH